ncbi:hypothetical protein [Streptomyces sp. 3213.3]|uniref:hypothetical protein n=1 Tax=Streptomyces sp. 3213.3 TaxID=1855348 RepID=UPI00135C3B1A|nr:hypothetical protein [Streptomyces sp. 3213.3]
MSRPVVRAALRGGANSMTMTRAMARHSGMSPPSPRPAMNRLHPIGPPPPAVAQIVEPQ